MDLIKRITGKLRRKPLLVKPVVMPRIISMWEHTGWGDNLQWTDWENRRLYGFLNKFPKEGDILRAKMSSGKIARFRFEEIEPCNDPKDMFFASVSDLEYEA